MSTPQRFRAVHGPQVEQRAGQVHLRAHRVAQPVLVARLPFGPARHFVRSGYGAVEGRVESGKVVALGKRLRHSFPGPHHVRARALVLHDDDQLRGVPGQRFPSSGCSTEAPACRRGGLVRESDEAPDNMYVGLGTRSARASSTEARARQVAQGQRARAMIELAELAGACRETESREGSRSADRRMTRAMSLGVTSALKLAARGSVRCHRPARRRRPGTIARTASVTDAADPIGGRSVPAADCADRLLPASPAARRRPMRARN